MTTSVKAAQAKLVIAVLLDLADFVVGRIVGFGTGFDVVITAIGFAMFGWKGLAQAWEIPEITDQLDGFIPTLTLVALAELRSAKKREAQNSTS